MRHLLGLLMCMVIFSGHRNALFQEDSVPQSLALLDLVCRDLVVPLCACK